jgi:pyruvate/2-oxoglutarate/acetoin dehydrogenase E1 component
MDRILSYAEAIHEAIEQEMLCDSSVVIFGQGVDDHKAILGTTKEFVEKFGSDRVFDTPLSEDGMTGVAVGAALAGLRPIHTHIRMDFVLLAMNQIINVAAKMCYMFGGSLCVPMVVRSIIGRSWGQGAQHSQSIYPLLMNIPGIKIVAPTSPYDAKGCLVQSIRDNNPTMFIEHRLLYYQKGHVPIDSYTVPFGKAKILIDGNHITLVGISHMLIECLRAQKYLKEIGIEAEVIDPVSLSPLDIDTILNSALKTKRLLIVDNSWVTCGAGAEIVAGIVGKTYGKDIMFDRMGFASVPCPTTPTLESAFYPNAKTIASQVFKMVCGKEELHIPDIDINIEENEFKGPF